jgi:hypothetical protein
VACGVGSVPPQPGDGDHPAGRDDDDDDLVGGAPDAGSPASDDDDAFDTSAEMLEAFGDCMRYDDWLTAGLLELPRQLATDDDGTGQAPCSSCHEADGPGAYLGLDARTTFMRQRSKPTIYKLAMVVLADSGEPGDVVPNHRYELKGQEPTQHPDFVLDPELVEGLTLFFDRTYNRFQAEEGACERVDPI